MNKQIKNNVKTLRGWNGKLNFVNELCNLIDSLDLLSESLSDRYSETLRQYYRYYNDGDHPRLVIKYGIKKSDGEKAIEEALETELDTVLGLVLQHSNTTIRSTLRKRLSYSRLNIIVDSMQKMDLYSVVSNPEEENSNQGYWVSQLKEIDHKNMPDFKQDIDNLYPLYRELRDLIKTHASGYSNVVLFFVHSAFEKNDTINPDVKKQFFALYDELQKQTLKPIKTLKEEIKNRSFLSDKELKALLN